MFADTVEYVLAEQQLHSKKINNALICESCDSEGWK